MDINYYVFRKASFGGFNRKDVIDYIESIKNEYADYKSKAEKKITELQARVEELEAGVYRQETAIEETLPAIEAAEAFCEEDEQQPETQQSVIDCLCLNAEEKEAPACVETAVISDEMERFYETIKNFSFDYEQEEKHSVSSEKSILDSITTFIF